VTDVVTEHEPPTRRRARVRITAAIVAVVVTAAAMGWWYRASGSTLRDSGFGIAGPVVVGDAFHVGVPLSTDHGVVHLGRVEIDDPVPDVEVEYAISDKSFAAIAGDPEAQGFTLSTPYDVAVGSDLHDPTFLVVSLTPTHAGMFRFDGVRVEYGSGLRRHSKTLDVDICVIAVEDQSDVAEVDTRTCETP
jgi:hypothetical protein